MEARPSQPRQSEEGALMKGGKVEFQGGGKRIREPREEAGNHMRVLPAPGNHPGRGGEGGDLLEGEKNAATLARI